MFFNYALTGVDKIYRYNKYTQIAARAVRQSLKENERVAAEKRGLSSVRYQHWEDGKGGEQVAFPPSFTAQ
jgi:F-type H+-transporting ATPase subunit epsilon